MAKIIIGPIARPTLTLDNNTILSATIQDNVDPTGSELMISTIEIDFTTASSVLASLTYGTQVRAYSNEKIISGCFYIKGVKQTGPKKYNLTAQNWAGVFDDVQSTGINLLSTYTIAFNGGWSSIFTLASTKMKNLIQKIEMKFITPTGHDTIGKGMKGYIPPGTLREVLQQYLIALNMTIVEREDGKLVWRPVNTSSIWNVNADETYATGSVSYESPISRISVTEHNYTYSTTSDKEVIFDNTYTGKSGESYLVSIAGAPVYDLYFSGGLQPDTSNGQKYMLYQTNQPCFYVTGAGKIEARRYIDQATERIAENPNNAIGEELSVDIQSITVQNSAAILSRLKAYYFSSRETISAEIVWDGEICGNTYTVPDAIGRTSSGNLEGMTTHLSSLSKSNLTLSGNWVADTSVPYSNTVLLTGSGSWTVPDGVTKITAVLIGGGSGGYSGTKGADGSSDSVRTKITDGNKGGTDGDNGANGKVYSVIIDNPTGAISYSCGSGGAGAPACSDESTPNEGSIGTDTTFGSYSSAAGSISETGYTNPINGARYAYKCLARFIINLYNRNSGFWDIEINDGVIDHGFPCDTPYIICYKYKKNTKTEQVMISSVENHRDYYEWHFSDESWAYFVSGSPGGNSYMARGQEGTLTTRSGDSVQLGNGGDGAIPVAINYTPLEIDTNAYGCGGFGGFGGGAGGDAGFATHNGPSSHITPGIGGVGANGSAGGPGSPGCVVIFY